MIEQVLDGIDPKYIVLEYGDKPSVKHEIVSIDAKKFFKTVGTDHEDIDMRQSIHDMRLKMVFFAEPLMSRGLSDKDAKAYYAFEDSLTLGEGRYSHEIGSDKSALYTTDSGYYGHTIDVFKGYPGTIYKIDMSNDKDFDFDTEKDNFEHGSMDE